MSLRVELYRPEAEGGQDERASPASDDAMTRVQVVAEPSPAMPEAASGISAIHAGRAGPLIALGVLSLVAAGAVGVARQAAAPVVVSKAPVVDRLAASVGEMRADMDRTALRVALLEARAADSAAVEPGGGGDEFRALAAAVALFGLQQRARADTPFAADLAVVRPLLQDLPGSEAVLTTLVAHAAGGVPSGQDLALEFRRLLPLLRGQVEAQATAGQRGRGFLRDLLATLHLAEPVEADPGLAILAQAETELARGRLAGAVATLDHLVPASRVIVSGWLAAARVRLAVDESVDTLLDRALAALAQGR